MQDRTWGGPRRGREGLQGGELEGRTAACLTPERMRQCECPVPARAASQHPEHPGGLRPVTHCIHSHNGWHREDREQRENILTQPCRLTWLQEVAER